MDKKSQLQAITDPEIILSCLVGQAVCKIQLLEDALSTSMAIRKTGRGSKNRSKGDEIRNKYRKLTLGEAVNLTIEENIYTEWLQKELQDFKKDRNWLIHKSMHENLDDMATAEGADKLFKRIRDVGNKAHRLQQAVEVDLMNYTSSQGMDMTEIYTTLKEVYG